MVFEVDQKKQVGPAIFLFNTNDWLGKGVVEVAGNQFDCAKSFRKNNVGVFVVVDFG